VQRFDIEAAELRVDRNLPFSGELRDLRL